MTNQVVLSLGGNIGNVRQSFKKAVLFLEKKVGTVSLTSSIYQTKAWGVENQLDFLNKVITIETDILPIAILEECLRIEKKIGRVRKNKKKWTERVIDIDILFYQNEIIETPGLIVPHPHLHQRNFILYPLTEILPHFVHPILTKTVLELKKSCNDNLQVVKTLD